jgi:methyl-accepting chemotaxis protein
MKRPSIKVALITVFATLLIICGGMGYVAITGLSSTNGATTEIATNWLPSVSVINAINTATSDYRLGEAAHILSLDKDQMNRAEVDMKAIDEEIAKLRGNYEKLISSDFERETYKKFSKEWADYTALHETVLNLSRANKNEDAARLFKGDMRQLYDGASQTLVGLIKLNSDGSSQAFSGSKTAYTTTLVIALTALGLLGIVLVGSTLFALFGIANPITRIAGAMKDLSAGDTDSEISFNGRQDEIGAMAAAVEIFRQGAIANKRLEVEAEDARRRSEAERLETQRKAEEDAAERLRIATSGLAAGLQRLAAGDLSFQLNEAFAPDFEALRHDFNQSVEQLGSTLSVIADTIVTMEDGTREIANGADDLSRRTEQQAASLEETAAAVEEITSNVQSSTKLTKEAREVASQANQSALKSAEVVTEAESAMRKIETSSQQISNIIGVIDEIAFQTNLLALNAGVEAARAGEAGKGFAVVAQEVRELAQRAAQAAKEIKDLIKTSSTDVDSGVKLVRDAGEALKTIGVFIGEMNGHMTAIATAAQEQATGLGEVNTAVNQMDQTTQQNAAMVEQSTAASNSLAQEAAKLRELVSQFTLAGGSASAGQVVALRQTARAMSRPNAGPAERAPTKVAANGGWNEF